MKWTGNKETVVVVTCKRWEKTETEQRQEEEETSWTLYFILKQRNDHHIRVRPLFHAYYQRPAISRAAVISRSAILGPSHPLRSEPCFRPTALAMLRKDPDRVRRSHLHNGTRRFQTQLARGCDRLAQTASCAATVRASEFGH